MICQNCGARLEAGSRFCNSCGAPVGAQPSGEEIRARVRDGGRHAAPSRSAGLRGEAGGRLAPLYCLCAGLLSLLQPVYLFVKTLFVSFGSGQDSFAVSSYSFFSGLREGGSTFLGVLLLLMAVALAAAVILPGMLGGRPGFWTVLGLSVLLLTLWLIALSAIRSAFDGSYLGARPRLGLFGWLFLLNCILIPGLIFLAEGPGAPAPAAPARSTARAAASRPTPARTARPTPARQVQPPRRPGARGPVRPASPAKNVTPPDQETINALRRMAQMHRQGLISEEEFARIKAECVARGWIRE